MNNPINPLGRNIPSPSSSSNNTQAKQSGSPDTASQPASADTVSISQQSQQVSSLQQELKSASGIDQQKVDAIKQEIANGNYPLDPDKIAENLIILEQSLLE